VVGEPAHAHLKSGEMQCTRTEAAKLGPEHVLDKLGPLVLIGMWRTSRAHCKMSWISHDGTQHAQHTARHDMTNDMHREGRFVLAICSMRCQEERLT